jgi:hypothetical protein
MEQDNPKSWIVAAAIIAIWLLAAIAIIYTLAGLGQR